MDSQGKEIVQPESPGELGLLPHGSSPEHQQLQNGPFSNLPTTLSSAQFHAEYGTICARIVDISNHDFRAKSWYLDCLYSIMSFTTGTSPVFLAQAMMANLTQEGLWQYLVILIGGGTLLPISISLCGITADLEPRKLQQNPLSIIKTAIDPGRSYRMFRYTCWVCFPVPIICTMITSINVGHVPFAPLVISGATYLLGSIFASVVALWSIYSLVLCEEKQSVRSTCRSV